MRWLSLVLALISGAASAQTREVFDHELDLTVSVAHQENTYFAREMVLITIHGVYRRHITLEKLEQPSLDGFNWSQLGEDQWYETIESGKRVKNFKRRMALYPDRAGTLTIGPFVHHLTLTDEGDDWFEHDVRSDPITIDVRPAPDTGEWWFPVRGLQVSDQWSNAPDQLQEGEGVLRVIRVEAVGATPEMIPPMPELTSPSAMIFAHPEKRISELSPEGPVTYAFWRWTIRPTNGASAILEPIRFSYFDTRTRESHEVTIGAQRVAYGDATGGDPLPDAEPRAPRTLARVPVLALGTLVFVAALGAMLGGRRFEATGWRRLPGLDPLARALWRAARQGDVAALRRAGRAIMRRDGGSAAGRAALDRLDRAVFGNGELPRDLRPIARDLARQDVT